MPNRAINPFGPGPRSQVQALLVLASVYRRRRERRASNRRDSAAGEASSRRESALSDRAIEYKLEKGVDLPDLRPVAAKIFPRGTRAKACSRMPSVRLSRYWRGCRGATVAIEKCEVHAPRVQADDTVELAAALPTGTGEGFCDFAPEPEHVGI